MIFFRLGCWGLIVTGCSHLAFQLYLQQFLHLENSSIFIGVNQTERNLLGLMNSYKRDIGGSQISMMNIHDGLSLCYSLFFLWMGILCLFLSIRTTTTNPVLQTLSFFNAVALGAGMIISMIYFFWLPSISFGVTMVFFLIAFFTIDKTRKPYRSGKPFNWS